MHSMDMLMTEPLDIEQKTRLTLSQHLAFKAACQDIGIKQADVQRALILQFLRDYHANTALQAVGIASTARAATE